MTAEVDKLGIDLEFDESAPSLPAAEAAPTSEPAAKTHRVEIDLGDGSGKQVFEAPTSDELVAKLAEAQTNATRKIRDQERRLRAQRSLRRGKPRPLAEDTPPKIKPLSVEELAQLQQQLYNDPLAALPRLLEGSIGLTAEELRDAVATSRTTKRVLDEQAAAEEFIAANPEYVSSPKNYRLIKDYLDEADLEFTAENLQIAYEELTASGLLESAPQPKAEASPAAPAKSADALPGRSAPAPTAEVSVVPNVEDFMKLSPQQQRQRILELQRAGRK